MYWVPSDYTPRLIVVQRTEDMCSTWTPIFCPLDNYKSRCTIGVKTIRLKQWTTLKKYHIKQFDIEYQIVWYHIFSTLFLV